jgi:tRNA dimethylallyltransferase
MSADPPILPILTGPTASGKTALAIEVASRLGMEILSADSRQVYRGLEVATAAPSPEELASVRHHLISHVSPFEEYSAGRFCRETRAVLGLPEEGASPGSGLPGRLPYLVCGGSGFYLRAFLDPVHPALGSRPELREKVKALGRELGDDGLKAELLSLDPEAEWIPAADRTKIERYLEISLASGMPASRAMRELVLPRPVTPRIFALHAPISWLGSRIRKRAWWMLRHGMVKALASRKCGNCLKVVPTCLSVRNFWREAPGSTPRSSSPGFVQWPSRRSLSCWMPPDPWMSLSHRSSKA